MFMMGDRAEIRVYGHSQPRGANHWLVATGEGQELLLLINCVGNLGGKGTGYCRGTPGVLEKILWSFLEPHGLTSPQGWHYHPLLVVKLYKTHPWG